MSDKPFFSILTLTFASEGDLRIWRDKVEMFSNEKAIAYLKQHGQRSLTIVETRENDTIKGVAMKAVKPVRLTGVNGSTLTANSSANRHLCGGKKLLVGSDPKRVAKI